MLHGAERDAFDLSFALPSECADRLAAGDADIGIVPVVEVARQKLDYFPETGIACHGPVRSILLVSKAPLRDIRTLAADAGSRTSVMLARIILAERYGVEPKITSQPADLASMLGASDAALVIGDAALRIEPSSLPFETLDLGGEWNTLTGLPMVFAVWGGRNIDRRYAQAFVESCRFGRQQIAEIAREQAPIRQIPEELANEYLTRHIVFELGRRDHQGMKLYLDQAARFEKLNEAAAV